jgi:hypothetical protein
VAATRSSKRLELVVQLERWEVGREYDRLGLDTTTMAIQGVHIPMITMPTRIFPLNGRAFIRLADVLTALGCDCRWDQKDVLRCIPEGYDFTRVGQHVRPMLRTEEQFFVPADFKALRPVAALQAVIDRYVAQFEGTVGIHLRRTDNARAKQASPTDLFIAAMERELEMNAASRFFLATDDPEEEILLQKRFGDRLIMHPKRSRRRDDPLAIQDAVVDLYCLAACRRIYGSFWSSFSETAQQLGSAELLILQSRDAERSS